MTTDHLTKDASTHTVKNNLYFDMAVKDKCLNLKYAKHNIAPKKLQYHKKDEIKQKKSTTWYTTILSRLNSRKTFYH